MPNSELENLEQAGNAPGSDKISALTCNFCLGDWHVSPTLNRITHRHSREERQLEPRLMKLLCFLSAHEDHVLSRVELVEELWPRVVVNENSLTRAISELRKKLQSGDSMLDNYIETIPKRGYRLIPRVEFSQPKPALPTSDFHSSGPVAGILSLSRYSAALSAVCLCLLMAGWIAFERFDLTVPAAEPVMLSDEVLEPERDYLGGKLQLSTLEGTSPVVQAIATPVVSQDEKQYAFIQYDTRGSTIFLGGLGTAVEPVPVYFSDLHLFNLAWSPLGNNLLFARQATKATTAMYAPINETAELVMLNLNTLETSRMVEEINPVENTPASGLNLT